MQYSRTKNECIFFKEDRQTTVHQFEISGESKYLGLQIPQYLELDMEEKINNSKKGTR